jgi:hypothetical protein
VCAIQETSKHVTSRALSLSVYNLRLSQRWLWRMSSSGMWRCVDIALTDVSEEHRLIQDLHSATSQKTTFFFLCLFAMFGLLFDPENWGDISDILNFKIDTLIYVHCVMMMDMTQCTKLVHLLTNSCNSAKPLVP